MASALSSAFAWRCWIAASIFCMSGMAGATSIQVAPIRLVLSSLRPIAAMTVGNSEDSDIAVQAEIVEWSQDNGKDVYKATQDVLVNPAIFRLPGNSQQIVRIGLRISSGPTERSYRVFLQQLPRDQALPTDVAGTGAGADRSRVASLQTLLRIGVPVFIPPVVATHEVQWHLVAAEPRAGERSGSRHLLVMDNRGTEHVQLSGVVVRSEQGVEIARESLSQYVLAGQSSTVPLDLPSLAPDAELRIEVQSDAAVALPAASVRVPRREATPN